MSGSRIVGEKDLEVMDQTADKGPEDISAILGGQEQRHLEKAVHKRFCGEAVKRAEEEDKARKRKRSSVGA